uniref:Uncharacterized protein n=1 Tax=Rhizophora mucronata TaxID=61149 RepID=A0A2P2NHN7_RHIMU
MKASEPHQPSLPLDQPLPILPHFLQCQPPSVRAGYSQHDVEAS